MQMLYDSDAFTVVHINANEGELLNARHCFEIVDKRANVELCLDGDFAKVFQKLINSWQKEMPDQAVVEHALDEFSALAQLPMVMH